MADNEDDKIYLNASDGTLLTVRMGVSPLTYMISPSFIDALETLDNLKMPREVYRRYHLRFLSVEDFLRGMDYARPKLDERYRNYTVQTFGLISDYKRGMRLPLPPPDPSQYKCQPMYWTILDLLPIQIWRIRVFSCPLGKVKTSIHNPFGVFPSGTVYVEQRWHPQAGVSRYIGGLEKPPSPPRIGLDQLYEDALRILEGNIKRGRPRGTTEYTRNTFGRDLKKYYRKLWKQNRQRPSKTAVAVKMGISRASLYNYLKLFTVRWPPL